MNADDHSAPIPIASSAPSHHVRSLSFSFGTPSLSASSFSSYSPTSPSPILAQTLPSWSLANSPNTSANPTAFTSPRPICGFASGKDWASAASWAGGSAVEEEDEVEDFSGVRIVAPTGSGSGSSLGVMGMQGKPMGPKAASVSVIIPGSGAGKGTAMATEKGAGLMRRLSLGGGGLFRPNVQRTSPPPLAPASVPMTSHKSDGGLDGLPPSSSGLDNARPSGMQGRPRKASVGGKAAKRTISPTGERLLRGGGGGGSFF